MKNITRRMKLNQLKESGVLNYRHFTRLLYLKMNRTLSTYILPIIT
jgi:hypothetical protein